MNTISSEAFNQCLKYCESKELDSTNYGTFIRSLVYTMITEQPVEIIDNDANATIKARIKFFSIDYTEGQEGVSDVLNIEYTIEGEEEKKLLKFEKIGRVDVVQDKKSSSKSFFRYYINKNGGYRFTFNRRISKAVL
ncbi:hypothetical protein [Alkaliphilus serpentinus]|uniref:Uncharacterized protein n=1 Tax=Alkaliphilus serpentinus TaxID=1482731 RepID=A0A833M9Q2_9FIRM|nr:hypothetical protein [Alkaliphilus serpentinus]KAB3530501.1 hypothetical protein F8153_06520 [Alkaliphilus serpentinus]